MVLSADMIVGITLSLILGVLVIWAIIMASFMTKSIGEAKIANDKNAVAMKKFKALKATFMQRFP